jgi:poly [ADP-ribose] polymerase
MNYISCNLTLRNSQKKLFKEFEFNDELNENSIKDIAKWCFSFGEPFSLISNDNTDRYLNVDVLQRGWFYSKKGEKLPSLHTSFVDCQIHLKSSNLKDKILMCVNANTGSNAGNYKKYYIQPNDDELVCKYGELELPEEQCRKVTYNRNFYWWLYFEKLSKLYTDESAVLKEANITLKQKRAGFKNEDEKLYDMLYKIANHYVEEHLISSKVTIKQVQKARKLFEELGERKTVKGFNTKVMELMKLSPRKRDWKRGDSVQMFLANSTDDFERIIEREEDLLLAMEAVISNDDESSPVVNEVKNPSFADFNIKVRKATDQETDFVRRHLSDTITSFDCYKVMPSKQYEKFSKYKDSHNSEIKYLWHGSRASNWISIIKNSLYCPKVASNGRMFGNGIYLAPSSMKSLGYTDGGYWAGGQKTKQILGLYKTAYNPLCYSKGSVWSYNEDYKNKTLSTNHTCLHAKSGDFGLRNDEVIFYNDDAVCLEYLVIIN